MVFSSIIFCTIFLPVCLAGYFLIPRIFGFSPSTRLRAQNIILLIFSIIFYAFGGLKYLLLIFWVILINWCGGRLCSLDADRKNKKLYLVGTIVIDLLILFFFKYFNLFIACIENIFFAEKKELSAILSGLFSGTGNGALGIAEIVLPVGISFFTFQAMSYVIDVYNDKAKAQDNFWNFALYIICFPQLIAGPIVHYKDISEEITLRTTSRILFNEGIRRFCFGLAKKVLIANTLGEVVDKIWALDISKIDATTAWVGAIFYTFQIYYDFSGYSDMAIGIGKILGFHFKENFNYPYQSTSIREFWRRWHISLSTWFRDYLYIPLGGSRNGLRITCRNLFIVFLLTGIWHGANFTFLFWGVAYGVLLIIERCVTGKFFDSDKLKFLKRIIVFAIVNFLWVVFRADNIFSAFTYLSRMFAGGIDFRILFANLNGMAVIMFIVAILFNGFLQRYFSIRSEKVRSVIAIILYMVCLVFMVNGTYNPFIYFQF